MTSLDLPSYTGSASKRVVAATVGFLFFATLVVLHPVLLPFVWSSGAVNTSF